MKKLFSLASLVLSAALLVAPVSAAAPADTSAMSKPIISEATKLYAEYSKAMQGVKSMELEISTASTYGINDIILTEPLTTSGTAKWRITAQNEFELESHMGDGQSNDSGNIYYKDGYLYFNNKGEEKYKYKAEPVAALTYVMGFDNYADATADILDKASVRAVSTGMDVGKLLNYELTLSDFAGSGNLAMEEIYKLTGDKDKNFDIKLRNFSNNLTVDKDGKFNSGAYTFDVDIALKDLLMTMKIKFNSKVISYNKVNKISFPDDLKTYKIVDASSISSLK